MEPKLYYFVTPPVEFCQKYTGLVILEDTKWPDYLYCDNPWLYVFISDLHFFSRLSCMSIGVSSHSADNLTHANNLQKSHMSPLAKTRIIKKELQFPHSYIYPLGSYDQKKDDFSTYENKFKTLDWVRFRGYKNWVQNLTTWLLSLGAFLTIPISHTLIRSSWNSVGSFNVLWSILLLWFSQFFFKKLSLTGLMAYDQNLKRVHNSRENLRITDVESLVPCKYLWCEHESMDVRVRTNSHFVVSNWAFE